MSRLTKSVLFGLLLAIFGAALALLPQAHQLEENLGLAILFGVRGPIRPPADAVIVSIDRHSAERLGVSGNPAHWPRSLHARLVEKLVAAGARVVVFDVYFIESRSPAEDQLFASAVRRAGNVVLAEVLRSTGLASETEGADQPAHRIVKALKPIDPLAEAAAATAPFALPRVPVRVNHFWTFHPAAGDAPSLPVLALHVFALDAFAELVRLRSSIGPGPFEAASPAVLSDFRTNMAKALKELRYWFEHSPGLAERMVIELERSGSPMTDRTLKALLELHRTDPRRYLNYYGPPRTIHTVAFHDVLQSNGGVGPNNPFKGKAVFVGLSETLASDRADSFYTVFSRPDGVSISGVEIAATAFSNLLEGTALKAAALPTVIAILFAWGFIIGLLFRATASGLAALSAIILGGLYFGPVQHRFSTEAIWYPVVVPLFFQAPVGFFAAVMWRHFEVNRERRRVRAALRYYIPDEVVDEVANNLGDMQRGGETIYGACLFTDAADYTTLSEGMDPRALNDFMHRYYGAIFEPIRRNNGVVVDIQGDSIVAIWKGRDGDPAVRKRACEAALGVSEAITAFNQSFEHLRLPTRISVHAGRLFLGNIGAGERYRYGVTGDTVVSASRMDSLNKQLGTQILISEDAIRDIDDFMVREVGRFRLKGKSEPLRLYELLGRIAGATDPAQTACARFGEAVRCFQSRAWDRAEAIFREFIEDRACRDLARFYLKRCEEYKKKPLEEPWDGVISMEQK
ncbi:MAG TPA: adenylate/guanylate cyclase domain-containing protein [Candidatus Eisenbacteria bacterium]|nr:adenylate/guanylate cyclase domain-containing protein [Candidatus Eisenbacteria bacterium]